MPTYYFTIIYVDTVCLLSHIRGFIYNMRTNTFISLFTLPQKTKQSPNGNDIYLDSRKKVRQSVIFHFLQYRLSFFTSFTLLATLVIPRYQTRPLLRFRILFGS